MIANKKIGLLVPMGCRLIYSKLKNYFNFSTNIGHKENLAQRKQLKKLIHKIKPTDILEVGVFQGERAIQMCSAAFRAIAHKKRKRTIYYLGFDLFEEKSSDICPEELSGGKNYDLTYAQESIDNALDNIDGDIFNTHFVKGDTNKTLNILEEHYGFLFRTFAYIDGDRLAKTIQNDGDATSYIKHRVFDGYYLPDKAGKRLDISVYGCNAYIDSLDKNKFRVKILPKATSISEGGLSKLVYVKKIK